MPVELRLRRALLPPRQDFLLAAPLTPRDKAFVSMHPHVRQWLTRLGLTTPAAYLSLSGEIISGHHDRHVMRVLLTHGRQTRAAYLKRELSIGWKVRRRNRREGFGPVSRSVREARMLEHLENLGLGGPQWMAYGEDGQGRAFLLVQELTDHEELRSASARCQDPRQRRELAEQIGRSIAEIHRAQISTPDLAAKHLFLRTQTGGVALVDWPSAQLNEAVPFMERVKALAQLHASLVEDLANTRERLAVLRGYRRHLRDPVPLRTWVRQIHAQSQKICKRSSVQAQRANARQAARLRLVWLADDESVCVRPELAHCWPRPSASKPFYVEADSTFANGVAMQIIAPDGKPALLTRWRSLDPLGRFQALLRGRRWRSPAARQARQLFELERHGRPGPRLLAFGQRLTSPVSADSFLLVREELADRDCPESRRGRVYADSSILVREEATRGVCPEPDLGRVFRDLFLPVREEAA